MGRIILALTLALSSLTPQDIKWKKSWPEALKEAKASNKKEFEEVRIAIRRRRTPPV